MRGSQWWDALLAETEHPHKAARLLADQLKRQRDAASSAEYTAKVLQRGMLVATELAHSDRSEEALAALRATISVFESVADREIAATVYRARASSALLLDRIGRHDAAVEILRKMVAEQGALGTSSSMDRAWFYASMHLCQLDEGSSPDPDDQARFAVASVQRLLDRFGALELDDVRQGLAELLHGGANALVQLNDEQAAARMLSEIVHRWDSSADEHVRAWVRITKVRLRLLESVPLPKRIVLDPDGAGRRRGEDPDTIVSIPWVGAERQHVLRNAALARQEAQARARQEAAAGLGRRTLLLIKRRSSGRSATYARIEEQIEADSRDKLEIYEKIVSDAVRANFAAREIVDSFRLWAEPFLLYLRNFESEATYALVPNQAGDGEADLPNTYFNLRLPFPGDKDNPPRITDASLIAGLRQVFTVVTATNGYGGGLDEDIPGPRLLMPDLRWRETVLNLIGVAELVVFRIVLSSPGVRDEIDMIRSQNRMEDTIVVIPRPEEQQYLLENFELQKEAYSLDKADVETVPKDSPMLSGLRVFYEDELYDPETQSGVFIEPARHFRELKQMDPPDRFIYLAEKMGIV